MNGPREKSEAVITRDGAFGGLACIKRMTESIFLERDSKADTEDEKPALPVGASHQAPTFV